MLVMGPPAHRRGWRRRELRDEDPGVKNCKFCNCRYQNVCGNTSLVCVVVQYVAIIGVLAWAAYLFFHTAS